MRVKTPAMQTRMTTRMTESDHAQLRLNGRRGCSALCTLGARRVAGVSQPVGARASAARLG
jgi:hypothetical protein